MNGLLAILQVLVWFPLTFCFLALGYNIVAGMFRSSALLAKHVQEKGTLPTREDVNRIIKAQYWIRYGRWMAGIGICMVFMIVFRILYRLTES